MNEVLLTVSGYIPPDLEEQVARGFRPEADYRAMARAFDADLMDYAVAEQRTGRVGRLLRAIGGKNLMLAWACFRAHSEYRVVFTDGEQVGLPLAGLLRLTSPRARPRHLMIAHRLSARKKRLLLDWLGLARCIDVFIVYSAWQKRFIEARWAVSPQRVVFTPFMVDAAFFTPARAPAAVASPRPLLCAVGLEYRDYPTLIEAVRGLDVDVLIAAASPWSKRKPWLGEAPMPANVTVSRFDQFDLRELYARSCLVVMPLHDVDFQAGITALLEAMAMGRPVICSRTQGQTGVIQDGETGYCVEAGDAMAMRSAIERVLANSAEAEAVGQRARDFVLREATLPRYVATLNTLVRSSN